MAMHCTLKRERNRKQEREREREEGGNVEVASPQWSGLFCFNKE